LSQVSKDRWGRLFANAVIKTPDDTAYLAMDHGDLTSGLFRSRLASQAAQRNSGDTLTVENFIFAAVLALQEEIAVKVNTPGPNFVSVESFIRSVLPPGAQVVEGLLERGCLYSFASKPKVGKTILLLNLAHAVAGGSEWLGRRVTNGRVCVFQLEDSGRTLKRRLERMTQGHWPSDLLLHVDPFRLSDENYNAAVSACQGAILVICDPIIQASEVRDWNAQSEVRRTYELWRRLARDTDATVIVSAHHRKMGGDFGDQMAGSIQAQATVDGIIEIYRHSSLNKTERKVSFTGRDWSDTEDEVIWLDTETLTWSLLGSFNEVREMTREGQLQEKVAKVWNALPSEPPGLTYTEIETATSLGSNRVREAIRALGDRIVQAGTARSSKDPLKFCKNSE
jgi:hypothetical protein